jgi:hypothetical protein
MINVFKWPGVWFNIFKKPEETAALLKKEKPTLVDGIMSYGLASVSLGFLAFLLFAVISLLSLGGGNLAGAVIGLAFIFAILVIAFPIFMILNLLFYSAAVKASSMILKGKGKFSEECGLLGVTGSAALIIFAVMYAVIVVLMMVLMAAAGSFGVFILYPLMGILYLVLMPVVYLFLAFVFDVLAALEQVSIYRAGALLGLAVGILCCLMMLIFSVVMFSVLGAAMAIGGMS